MAKSQTKKSRYPSRYAPGKFITEAQYITEYVCENNAAMTERELPNNFWELHDWKTYFAFQAVIANRLLKEYSGVAIIAALKSWQGKRIYSLQAPQLIRLIQQEEARLEVQNKKQVDESKLASDNCAGRPSRKSKLDMLDG